VQYVFDNSAANPRNPQQPPQPVHWGQQSTDEMGDLWVQMLTRTDQDLQTLNAALQVKHATEEIVGYEVMIRGDPARISLRNDVAVLYAGRGEPDKAARHLAVVVQLEPESPAAHYNLGTALSSMGELHQAVEHYRQALRLRPDYALAHNNLGGVLLAMGQPDEALPHLRDAVQLDPQNASAHANLAWILATTRDAAARDVDEALRLAERATALTRRRDANVLDVLAAAQAAAGQFGRAVASCDEALALMPGGAPAAAVRERQTLYRQRRAYVSR
jgi:tetratricopeptide (TPR) repeat protein